MTLIFFTALAVAMTFVGGAVPLGGLLSRHRLSRLFSMRAGILLAVAFTELLPEGWKLNHVLVGWAALGAFGLLFVMSITTIADTCPEYLAECHVHYLGLTALVALCGHSFIDGFNLGVSFKAGAGAGVAVGLALALHKVADGFTLTLLFHESGCSRKKTLLGVALVSAATPLGAFASAGWASRFPGSVQAGLLGFAAGSFIFIAAADVLPRLRKESDRAGLLYLAAGILGMAALKYL